MAGETFDLSGLDQLSADLGHVEDDVGPKIQKAVIVTSAKIKRSWQRKLSGTPQVPFGPLTITYDVGANVGDFHITEDGQGAGANHVESQIGAEDGRKQAPIIAVLEYGSPVNNLPPHGYGTEALEENQQDFMNGLLLAIGDPLGKSTEQGTAHEARMSSRLIESQDIV